MNYKISYLLKEDSIPDSFVLKEPSPALMLKLSTEIEEILTEMNRTKRDLIQGIRIRLEQWTSLLSGVSQEIIFNDTQRQELIFLFTLSEQFDTSVFFFQDSLKVSKGTILNDIKKLRKLLAQENMEFLYSRKSGFKVKGDEFLLRRHAKNCIAKLLMEDEGRWGLFLLINLIQPKFYAETRDCIVSNMERAAVKITPSRLDEFIFYLALIRLRIGNYPLYFDQTRIDFEKMNAMKAANYILSNLDCQNQMEAKLVAIVLLTISQGQLEEGAFDFLLAISAEMIHELEKLAAIQFQQFRSLLVNTFCHMVPAYFRIRYGFYLPNIMIDAVKREYAEEYQLTKAAVQKFAKEVACTIPEEEIGFFTILFGGALYNERQLIQDESIRAVIVCPSGVSSSLILQVELQKMFPTIQFQEANSIDELGNISNESYDIVFSTVEVTTKKTSYIVKPLMNQQEKNDLLNAVQRDFLLPGISFPRVKEIVDALLPYVSLKEGVDQEKLYKVLNKLITKQMVKDGDERPMLRELLTEDVIQISNQKLDWEEAIALAAQPLLETGKIEQPYIQAMIEKVKQYGAFIHVGKGIALPHARPEDGVNKLGMSLLKVEQPVRILGEEKHEVTIFICLAAVDNESHLRALSNLTKILTDTEKLEQLLQAQTKVEILDVLKREED